MENAFDARSRNCGVLRFAAFRLWPPRSARSLYREGYAEGVGKFCTPENGYRIGRRNELYQEVCPPETAPEFIAAYRRGLTDWAVSLGYRGYWIDGVFTLHHQALSGSPKGDTRPPMPLRLGWDMDAAGDAGVAGLRASADRLRIGLGTQDWRELWSRSPPAPPSELVAAAPPPPKAAPPAPKRDKEWDDQWDDEYDWYFDRRHDWRRDHRKPGRDTRRAHAEPPRARDGDWYRIERRKTRRDRRDHRADRHWTPENRDEADDEKLRRRRR